MIVNEAMVSRALAVIRGAAGARVTTHNKGSVLKALDHLIALAQDARARVESGAGQQTTAGKASQVSPARSHQDDKGTANVASPEVAFDDAPSPLSQNSEDGASDAAPDRANSATPLSSLTQEDGSGHTLCAGNGHPVSAAPSSPNHSAAGQVFSADEAMIKAPARAVVPSAAQKAANIAAMERTADSIMDAWQVNMGRGTKGSIGDIRYADFETVIRANARDAASSAIIAATLAEIRATCGIPANWGTPVRELVTPEGLERITADVTGRGARALRLVAQQMRAGDLIESAVQ